MARTATASMEPRPADPEHIIWPFDGSYWRDELGGYTYDIKSKCTKKHFPPGWKPAALPTRAKTKVGILTSSGSVKKSGATR